MLRWWRKLPPDFAGTLEADEHVLAFSGLVVATPLGLWLPDSRRVGWHLISKATWSGGALTVVEATVVSTVSGVDLLEDQPPQRFVLPDPGRIPQVVHERVTGSIRSRHRQDLPGGGVWFLQRKVPGRGIVLQARPDPGTSMDLVSSIAASVAAKLSSSR
ncbi:hypothetical protein Lesp02_61320 [Lentzea sp. NBRC 105346]|uniref:hypothetical protein n=1 Tax=Lentzea sp. NBRC 105346 TaxID=3032205 RepID=UPI002552C7B3|nr:hypothetical protein [Lentzea sp. NBRC 105346]GLZ33944.1 hypothetical protein Lesp02_61320 [Lentzea sp. NBRC 105346]